MAEEFEYQASYGRGALRNQVRAGKLAKLKKMGAGNLNGREYFDRRKAETISGERSFESPLPHQTTEPRNRRAWERGSATDMMSRPLGRQGVEYYTSHRPGRPPKDKLPLNPAGLKTGARG